MKKVFDVTTFCILLMVLSLTIVIGLTTASQMKEVYVERSEQCRNTNYKELQQLRVNGLSMQPYAFEGETILVKKYNSSLRLVSGEILVVKNKDYNITHRVIGVYKDYFVMKGDNNREPDTTLYNYSSINGVVCGVLRT